jgi:hypothetical protein
MIVIRPEQVEVFRTVADAAFEQRLVEYLKENHADDVVQLPTGEVTILETADETLLKMVHEGVRRARTYGLTWESSIMSFVVLMFVVAPNFDEHSSIQSILTNETLPAESRIDQFWVTTSEEDWEAIEEDYDMYAWGLEEE